MQSFESTPFLSSQSIHIWTVNVDFENSEKIRYYSQFLSPDELKKANNFRFNKDRYCAITARYVLRMLSSKYLNIDIKDIEFSYGDKGKPKYNFETSLQFNISHSEAMILLGFVHNNDLGVDIEFIKPNFDPIEIAEHFFSLQEIEELKQREKSDLDNAFFRCWTRKEALIKATGDGLSFPLHKFSVSMDRDDKAEILNMSWNEDPKSWMMYSFKPKQDYIAAITLKSPTLKVKSFNWDDYKHILHSN